MGQYKLIKHNLNHITARLHSQDYVQYGADLLYITDALDALKVDIINHHLSNQHLDIVAVMKYGVSPRPDWFTERVVKNQIITHEGYCTYNEANVLRGEYVVLLRDDTLAFSTSEEMLLNAITQGEQ